MTTTNPEESLRSFIVAEFGHKLESPDFSANLDLLGEGVIDSMGVMQITTFFLEEELGLTVDDSDIVPDNFRSLESLIGFVHSKT